MYRTPSLINLGYLIKSASIKVCINALSSSLDLLLLLELLELLELFAFLIIWVTLATSLCSISCLLSIFKVVSIYSNISLSRSTTSTLDSSIGSFTTSFTIFVGNFYLYCSYPALRANLLDSTPNSPI